MSGWLLQVQDAKISVVDAAHLNQHGFFEKAFSYAEFVP